LKQLFTLNIIPIAECVLVDNALVDKDFKFTEWLLAMKAMLILIYSIESQNEGKI